MLGIYFVYTFSILSSETRFILDNAVQHCSAAVSITLHLLRYTFW